MFQIKDFPSIAASIINYAKSIQITITDFTIGSVARTMLEAPAVEIEELYQQMFYGLMESIPVAIYNSFNFSALPAVTATGLVTVNITPSSSSILIPAGSTFTPAGYSSLTFTSVSDVTISAGSSTANVQIEASVAGSQGNIVAETSFAIQPVITGFLNASSTANFTTGRDAETPEQRQARFAAYILTLNHGTDAAIQYGLSTANVQDSNGNIIESVVFQSVIEPYLTGGATGLVNCYIHNGTTGASSALLAQASNIINGYYDSNGNPVPGYKAAGVNVTISAATNVSINITCHITISSSYTTATVQAAVEAAIANYVTSLGIGANVLFAEIIAAAVAVPGVTNFALTSPSADVTITSTEKAVIGTFTLT